jgi:predicted Zn-dependent protease
VSKPYFVSLAGFAFCLLLFSSCSVTRIPTVSDYSLERQVADEIAPIIRVTKDRDRVADYRIQLADFPRKDILGMSVGERHIYISYELARAAFKNDGSRWLLRQILAHEVAHELSGHAKERHSAAAYDRAPQGVITASDIGLPAGVQFQNYSIDKELEADRVGMDYWKDLNWDCRIWVDILKRFQSKNYAGDANHPTEERLRQAVSACPAAQRTASANIKADQP